MLAAQPEFIIHISVDGLRPDAITNWGEASLPSFYKFRNEGAWTDQARTDHDRTITLPNHTSMITGRSVLDSVFGTATGHHVIENSDGDVESHSDWTLHKHDLHDSPDPIGPHTDYYVPSIFDSVHDNGLTTGAYAGKFKFEA